MKGKCGAGGNFSSNASHACWETTTIDSASLDHVNIYCANKMFRHGSDTVEIVCAARMFNKRSIGNRLFDELCSNIWRTPWSIGRCFKFLHKIPIRPQNYWFTKNSRELVAKLKNLLRGTFSAPQTALLILFFARAKNLRRRYFRELWIHHRNVLHRILSEIKSFAYTSIGEKDLWMGKLFSPTYDSSSASCSQSHALNMPALPFSLVFPFPQWIRNGNPNPFDWSRRERHGGGWWFIMRREIVKR